MPWYQFKCAGCGSFDRTFAMADVPLAMPCPSCTKLSARKFGGAELIQPGSPAMRLLDVTNRTASEPDVVGAPPVRTAAPSSRNPLHRKLPRP